MPRWILYAILSAFFASLVAIFGKIGIKGLNSNVAGAVRTAIIVFFACIFFVFSFLINTYTKKIQVKYLWFFLLLKKDLRNIFQYVQIMLDNARTQGYMLQLNGGEQ